MQDSYNWDSSSIYKHKFDDHVRKTVKTYGIGISEICTANYFNTLKITMKENGLLWQI